MDKDLIREQAIKRAKQILECHQVVSPDCRLEITGEVLATELENHIKEKEKLQEEVNRLKNVLKTKLRSISKNAKNANATDVVESAIDKHEALEKVSSMKKELTALRSHNLELVEAIDEIRFAVRKVSRNEGSKRG
jgi:Na+/phosphate symporter